MSKIENMTQEQINAIELVVSEFLFCHNERVEEHLDGFEFHSDVKAILEMDRLFLDGTYTSDLEPQGDQRDGSETYFASREVEAIKEFQK